MTPLRSRKNLFLTTILVTQFAYIVSAQAQTKVAESKDWSLWETSTNGVETCTLQTIDKVLFRSEDFIMELSKVKNNAASPLEIMMRIQKNKKESTGLSAQISTSNRFLSFSDMTGNKDVYWGTPKNLSALMTQLKNKSEDLAVKAKGGKKEIDFTIRGRGFSEMLTEMEKRCNASLPLLRQSFETEFLANVSDAVNPVTLTPAKTNQLRANYFAAYQIHTLLLETKSQLNQVLAKYQKLIDELATNRSEFNQITKSDLPASQKTMADAQKLQVDMKTEIARLAQLIPTLTAKVQTSQTAYDKSSAVLAPLEPEFNRLSSGLRNAQQLLANAESNLASLDRRLQEIASQISRLQNEAAQIQNTLPSRKMELDRAASVLRNAESARSQYNVSWERDRALRANPEYSSLQNERQILDSRLAPEQVRLQQLQSERNRIAKDLEICGSQAGIGTTPPGQVPGLTPPLVPGVIPPQEPQPAEPNGVDCSALEQAVANADQMIAQQRTVVDQINGRRNEVYSRIGIIESDINSEIQRINGQLVQNEEVARLDYRRIEQDVSQSENRLWSIRNSELPALVNENNQRMNERNTAQTQIAQGRQNVDQFTRDLTKFKLANDWDKKAADVDSKSRQLTADQNTLSDAQSLKLTSEKKLAQGIATETEMKKRIIELNARLAVLNQRADQLNVGLKNLPAERAPIDAKISAQQNELDTRKQAFLNGF